MGPTDPQIEDELLARGKQYLRLWNSETLAQRLKTWNWTRLWSNTVAQMRILAMDNTCALMKIRQLPELGWQCRYLEIERSLAVSLKRRTKLNVRDVHRVEESVEGALNFYQLADSSQSACRRNGDLPWHSRYVEKFTDTGREKLIGFIL